MSLYAAKSVPEAPLKDTKYKDVIVGYTEFTTMHGIPHINKAQGVVKKFVWTVFLLGCVAGLLYNVTSLTLTYLSFPVDTKNQFIHSTDIVFPAVSVCNYNPVKQSLLTMSPRLQALLAKWGADPTKKKRRKKRATTCAIYSEWGFMAEYCYTDSSVSYNTASAACASTGSRLAYLDNAEKTAFTKAQFGATGGWIGLYRPSTEYQWGGSTALTAYINWAFWAKKDATYDFIFIQDHGFGFKWNTDVKSSGDSTSNKQYICETVIPVTCATYNASDGFSTSELCHHDSVVSYETASSRCSAMSARLAYIDTPEITTFVQTQFGGSGGWIGLKKDASGNQFKWNGTVASSWNNWDTVNVDTNNDDYAYIILSSGAMKWQTDSENNDDSNSQKTYFCEKMDYTSTCHNYFMPDGCQYTQYCHYGASVRYEVASSICLKYSSKLAYLDTSEKTTFVQTSFTGSEGWIGLRRETSSPAFTWGASTPLTWTNWDSINVDAANHRYGFILQSSGQMKWQTDSKVNSDSTLQKSFYCEKDALCANYCPSPMCGTSLVQRGNELVCFMTYGGASYYQSSAASTCTGRCDSCGQCAKLAKTNTSEISTLLAGYVTQDSWIYLNLKSGSYVWGDGQDISGYANWASSLDFTKPNVYMTSSGQWKTTYYEKKSVLCEFGNYVAPPTTTTTLFPTTEEQTTTTQPTTVEETTTIEPTTVEETTTIEPTTVEETTTIQPTTLEETTTIQPTTLEETTTIQPTTVEETTTFPPTTVEETTTIQPTTVEETTTIQPTTLEERITIQPTTVEETTTFPPTTVEETTTIQPTTVEETTTIQPTTVEETTTFQPTTLEETTTIQPTTVKETTTTQPTTAEETTTHEPTTAPTTTTTVTTTTTQASTTPVPTSSFDDREPLREDFLVENEILEILAETPVEEKKSMGYSYAEFIVDCKYQGKKCDESNFGYFFDAVHGNCYVFNSGWNDNASLVFHTSYAGSKNGVSFTLNLVQPEYIASAGDAAGAVVVIHKQSTMPFPADQAILAPPGHLTSIGIRQMSATRLGGVYNDCQDVSVRDFGKNVFAEHFSAVNYSIQTCEITCYQAHVISTCGCADPQYLMEGEAFGGEAHACDARNITEGIFSYFKMDIPGTLVHRIVSAGFSPTKAAFCRLGPDKAFPEPDGYFDSIKQIDYYDCMYGISKQYINDELDCNCPVPCEDMFYKHSISNSLWPPERQMNSIALQHASNVNHIKSYPGYNVSTDTVIKKNFLKVTVFMEELNYQHLAEKPKYTFIKFIADIGAVSGLWIGCSILTLVEFFESGLDLFVLCLVKPWLWLKKKMQGRSSDGNTQSKRKVSPATSSKLKGRSSDGNTQSKRKVFPATPSNISNNINEPTAVNPRRSEFLTSPEYHISRYTAFTKTPGRKSTDSDAELHDYSRGSNASRLSATDINFDFRNSYSNQSSPIEIESPTDQKPQKVLRRMSTRRLLEGHNNEKRKEKGNPNRDYNKFIFGKLY